LALIAVASLYKLLWSLFDQVTPGLQAVGLEVVRFDGLAPTLGQRLGRVALGWLSVAGAGMGVIWAMADEDRLTWHDHISQTFLACRPDDEEESDD
jgi:uncharacterized RDD family membrane protein YckC